MSFRCPYVDAKVWCDRRESADDETYVIHCTGCHMSYTKFVWRSYSEKNVCKEWNRRVES